MMGKNIRKLWAVIALKTFSERRKSWIESKRFPSIPSGVIILLHIRKAFPQQSKAFISILKTLEMFLSLQKGLCNFDEQFGKYSLHIPSIE